MSKVLKTVAVVAGAVALVATGVGAIAGGALAATAATVGTIASVVSGVASIGAQLTQKTPPARGSITQVTVASDPPQQIILGESYSGGTLRHDVGYGATLNKVPNPYRGMVIVYSGCGPVEQLVEAQVDFASIGAYYSGFLATDSQLGETPESAALAPPLSAPMPGWGASSKLSGQAAILWNFKYDKGGKVFASGLPVLGAVWKGVKVYDPRLDSTYPGGSGAHRIDDEATWAWSDNPALHALAYAYGRRQNDVLVFGVGLDEVSIRIADFVTLANVCDANGWRVSGVIQEPGDRWANLKEILRAGCAEPVFAGGLLSLRVRAPQVALDTITAADLTDAPVSVTAMQSYRDRLNTVVPKYRSPEHNWELVSASQVQVSSYLTEDGEEMIEEQVYGLVRDADQAAQLAAYRLVDGREIGPITLTCGPRLRAYRPGECLNVELPEVGFDGPAVILSREVDPATMSVTFTLVGETEAKHAYALGLTGTPPPTPALGQTAEARDELRFEEKAWTQVGDRIAEDVSGTIKAGSGVADDKVTTSAMVDAAATLVTSFYKAYSWTVGASGTFVTIDDGADAADVSVDTGPKTTQQVFIDVCMTVRRAGGSNDNIEVRVRRDDGTILTPPSWQIEATNDKQVSTISFIDTDPDENATHVYEVQVLTDDSSTPVSQVLVRGCLSKTG